tara:strand:- start:238 stop:351 length:114 start_codon:yes stop_codon:yes gene_type:complete
MNVGISELGNSPLPATKGSLIGKKKGKMSPLMTASKF